MFRDVSLLDRLFDQILNADSDWPGTGGSPWVSGIRSVSRGTFPPLNIGASPDSVDVYIFAAGLDPKSLDVTLQQNILTVSGERQSQAAEKSVFYRRELFEGPFQRVITLPEDVDPDAVTAHYQNGVLHVRIGRREEVRPKQIQIH
jgi:HSP20 family protein